MHPHLLKTTAGGLILYSYIVMILYSLFSLFVFQPCAFPLLASYPFFKLKFSLKPIKLYTLNICILFYINYTSIKLILKTKTGSSLVA